MLWEVSRVLQPSMKRRIFRHLTSESCEHAGASALSVAYEHHETSEA